MNPSRADRIAALLAELAGLMAEQPQTELPQPRQLPAPVLLTVEEAAEQLRIGRTQAFHLIKTNQIQSVKIGNSRRIPAAAIDDYLNSLFGEAA